MKKEDMKKPYREEKTGSKPGLKIKTILFIFLFQFNIIPQVPINGFCKYNLLKTEEGFSNLFSLNFNNDTYTDLILFDPSKKEIVPLEGNSNGTFITKSKIKLNYELSEIITLTDINNNITGFAFTSRKGMKAGVFSFNETGKPSLKNEIEFNSYPQSVSFSSIDLSGRNYLLICGTGFNGLSLLNENLNSFDETKIIQGINFSHAVFADLNSDGFNDIAAFDFISNNIDFFFNNRYGEFTKIRSIETSGKIYSLTSADINMDEYDDLIFLQEDGINILLNDYMSSFNGKIFIKTEYKPDKFITGDFNKDGFIDIIYLSRNESIVSAIFAKDHFSFYPEIIYMKKEGIKNIIPYYSRFISGFAVLSSNGEIHTITRLNSFSNDVNISLGARPSAIAYFDLENTGINNICFFDEYNNSAKIIIRNNAGLPVQLYTFSLFENHKEILINNNGPFIKTFIFYSCNKKLIEVIRINFHENTSERFSLYSKGELKEIAALKKEEKDYLFALYVRDNKPGYILFNYSDGEIISENHNNFIDISDITDLSLTKNFSLYLWGDKNNAVTLSAGSLNNHDVKKIFSIIKNEKANLVTFKGDFLNVDKEIAGGFINSEESKSFFIASDSVISVINNNEFLDSLNVKSKNQIFIGEIKFNGLNRVMVYNPESKNLYRLEFIRRGKEAAVTKIAENLDINRFFIKNMNFKNYHLVYTNRKLNCISIKKI